MTNCLEAVVVPYFVSAEQSFFARVEVILCVVMQAAQS